TATDWFHHSYRVLNFLAPISIFAAGSVARHMADVFCESPFCCVTLLPAESAFRHGDNEAALLKCRKTPAGCMRRYPQISCDLSHAVGNLAVVQAHVAFRQKQIRRALVAIE